ncbi:hypothetical protein L7F22_033259 [Adiantum nelumboides]|nr:hypothetical protein [Adiantum nelumboides]
MAAILHPFYKTPELFADIPLLTLRSEYLNLMLSEDDQLVIDGEMSSFMNNLGPTYLRSVATRSEATRFPLSWWQNYGRQGLPQLCKLALRVLSQPRRPNVQQPLHAENGAENQPIGAENQPQEVAIDAPQVGEQVDGHRQPVVVMQPTEQPAVFYDLQAENPPVTDHWVRRSTRVTRPPDRYEPSLDYVMLTDCGEPSCYKEAMQREDSKKWFKAMVSEMQSLEKNHTWDLVDLPPGHKALPCKWVYKTKVKSDAASKYKARLVAKGYKQKHGVDFDEIFSPVVKLATLRLVLGLVAFEDMELKQMYVKTAFLHGDLLEMIYMMQPEGFVSKGREKKVCKLLKSLYGLKQSPRAWYHKFDAFMRSQGYKRCNSDHCLYTKKAGDGSLLLLILYVDDMLIASKNVTELDALQQSLRKRFDMKDLGRIDIRQSEETQEACSVAEVPSSSSSSFASDNSSDSSEEDRKGKKRRKKQRHRKGKKKARKSKSRRVDDSSTEYTSTDSSDSEDGHFYANKKNFYKANQYEDKSKKVREFKEGGQSIKFETFSGYKDASKALSFIQQFDIPFAGGRYKEDSKIRRPASYSKENART